MLVTQTKAESTWLESFGCRGQSSGPKDHRVLEGLIETGFQKVLQCPIELIAWG